METPKYLTAKEIILHLPTFSRNDFLIPYLGSEFLYNILKRKLR